MKYNGLGFIHIHTQDLLAFIIITNTAHHTPHPVYHLLNHLRYIAKGLRSSISRVDPKRWLA